MVKKSLCRFDFLISFPLVGCISDSLVIRVIVQVVDFFETIIISFLVGIVSILVSFDARGNSIDFRGPFAIVLCAASVSFAMSCKLFFESVDGSLVVIVSEHVFACVLKLLIEFRHLCHNLVVYHNVRLCNNPLVIVIRCTNGFSVPCIKSCVIESFKSLISSLYVAWRSFTEAVFYSLLLSVKTRLQLRLLVLKILYLISIFFRISGVV